MSDRTRNTAVGLTILVALGICMYGISLLGKGPHLGGTKQYPVTVITPNANGISPGAKVMLAGIQIGEVDTTDLVTDPTSGAVEARIVAKINMDRTLPQNTTASIIKPATGVGTTTLDLSVPGGGNGDIPKNGSGTIRIDSVETNPLAGIIPQKTLDQLNATIVALNAQLAYTPPEDVDKFPVGDPRRPRENATTAIVRFSRTLKSAQGVLDGVQTIVGNAEFQAHFRQVVANLEDASANLKVVLQKAGTLVDNADKTFKSLDATAGTIGSAATQASVFLDSTQKNVDRISAKLVETLGNFDQTLHDITKGKGTLGALANDPRLYESLNDLAVSLKKTSEELDIWIKQVEQEGLNLKLGGK